jgi:hypothetical protein
MLFHRLGSHHTVPPGRIALGAVFQAFHARLPSRRPSGTMRVLSQAGPGKLTLTGVDPGRADYNSSSRSAIRMATAGSSRKSSNVLQDGEAIHRQL